MAVRSLDQILNEIGSIYDPQIQNIRNQQGLIPQQIADEERGLQAKQTQAFDDIVSGARRRGMGFGGIPLSEQARYTSTEFLPALARLRQQGREKALSLEEALLGISERKNTLAQQLRQQDIDNDYRERVFQAQQEEQRRAAAAAAGGGFSPSFGGGGAAAGGAQGPAANFKMVRKAKGGYAFTDANGNPISAATFAAAKGIPFRRLLSDMAKGGDSGAKEALNFVGDDFGYDPRKVNTGLYNALTWGFRPNAQAPRPQSNRGIGSAAGALSRITPGMQLFNAARDIYGLYNRFR